MYLFCLSYHFPQPVSLDFRERLIFSAQRGRQGDNCSPAAPVKQNSEQTPSLWYPTRWRSTGTVTRIAGRCFQLHHCFLFFKWRLDFKKKNTSVVAPALSLLLRQRTGLGYFFIHELELCKVWRRWSACLDERLQKPPGCLLFHMGKISDSVDCNPTTYDVCLFGNSNPLSSTGMCHVSGSTPKTHNVIFLRNWTVFLASRKGFLRDRWLLF